MKGQALLALGLFYDIVGLAQMPNRVRSARAQPLAMIQVPNSEFLFALLSQFERQQIAADLRARCE